MPSQRTEYEDGRKKADGMVSFLGPNEATSGRCHRDTDGTKSDGHPVPFMSHRGSWRGDYEISIFNLFLTTAVEMEGTGSKYSGFLEFPRA